MPEQRGQVGVGLLVENDEPGVDRYRPSIDRMTMSADPVIRLEQRDPVALRQQPSR